LHAACVRDKGTARDNGGGLVVAEESMTTISVAKKVLE